MCFSVCTPVLFECVALILGVRVCVCVCVCVCVVVVVVVVVVVSFLFVLFGGVCFVCLFFFFFCLLQSFTYFRYRQIYTFINSHVIIVNIIQSVLFCCFQCFTITFLNNPHQ